MINRLAEVNSFSEKDFFNVYAKLSNHMGIIDKGIWYSLTDSKNNSAETASWGNRSYLDQIGYQDTRHSTILNYQDKEIVSYV